jgi:hypothetical protein
MVFSFAALFDSEIENLTDYLTVSAFVSTLPFSRTRIHITRLHIFARMIQ